MVAAPALARFGSAVGLGGTFQDAIDVTERMYEITITENDAVQIPTLDFRGTQTGSMCLRSWKREFIQRLIRALPTKIGELDKSALGGR